MEKKYIIGVDLGGTKIAAAIADERGSVFHSMTIPTMAEEGAEAVVNRIADASKELMERQGAKAVEVKAIGIGSPGFVNSKRGYISFASNLPGFEELPIVKMIEDRTGINTYVENDAKAAALGEMWFGAGRGCSNFVYMTVSTGIGGAIIANGDIYSGASNTTGEIGHMIVNPEGPQCGCGHFGCLEAYASGTAIAKHARKRIADGEESTLNKYDSITSKEVFYEAAKGDKLALEVIDYCLQYLGIGVANIVTLLNPERIIIGGGVSMAGSIVFDRVWEGIRGNSFPAMYEGLEIVPAQLKTDAGMIGAIGVVLTREKNK